MQPRYRLLILLVSCIFAALLVSCGVNTGQPLRDIHTEGQLDKAVVVDRSLCLTCHSEDNVIKATVNYGGQTGLNIHEPPAAMAGYYGDCTTCHQVDTAPAITCNQCHEYKLPDGWQ
ncbi:MAG: cytochrome c3 family protein [Coriobacteriales bacterium]|jgi:hypothetical protein|nr:cytochrome c3 family protein [Coriobacteriales bacterium]